MEKYIKADKASEYLKNLFLGYVSDGYYEVDAVDASAMVQAVIKDTPAEDVAPVVHTKWIDKKAKSGKMFPFCSNCKRTGIYRTAYCPHCGAKMDGE